MIKQFTVGVSKTVNLGNFNSMRVEASLTIEVPEGDDYGLLKMKAQEDLTTLLAETWRANRKGDDS